jgi:glycosyltransferase involved in cell wall biosynthesis
MKKILFVSALDFKEKSIQVIRKTPEAYAAAGWDVDYVVARDDVKNGNYSYERKITPENITLDRIQWRLKVFRGLFNGPFRILLNKLAGWIAIIELCLRAKKLMKSKQYDVIYGYEYHGVLAAYLCILTTKRKTRAIFVSRFQGTFFEGILQSGKIISLFFNLDHIFALSLKADLLIMTNDGTLGDRFLKRLHKPDFMSSKFLFLANGVDKVEPASCNQKLHIQQTLAENTVNLVCLSRLVGWKRVERSIYLMDALRNHKSVYSFHLEIIGGGPEESNLKALARDLQLESCITFTGPISNEKARQKLFNHDFFLSFYDSSNVGNPLFEAFRANLIPVTLNNGATSEWVIHKETGLLYNINPIDYKLIARDINYLVSNSDAFSNILKNIKNFEYDKIKTWKERLETEIEYVDSLLMSSKK